MPRTKEFGKLSENQFKRLIGKLSDLRNESSAIQVKLRGLSEQRLREWFGDGLWWAFYYEMSFGEALGCLLFILGKVEWIKRIAQLPHPQEAVLSEIADEHDEGWGPAESFSRSDLFGATLALQRNIYSIFLYRRSLCSLIEDARDNSSDDSLFKAIRVDRSVVTTPTAWARVSKAEALNDRRFFLRLKSALRGPLQRDMLGMDLKCSLFVLREMGFSELSDKQLEHLLVHVLKVYPNHPNAIKNLRKQFYESQKIKTL